MLKLTKFYELEISEVITQPIRRTHTNITSEGKITHTHTYAVMSYVSILATNLMTI